MVKVNNSSKKNRVPLFPSHVPPQSWFEYEGMLYFSIKWRQNTDTRWILDAVCFDPNFYTIYTEICGYEDIKVIPIPDEKISICYENDAV
jgi:hypothetical protein